MPKPSLEKLAERTRKFEAKSLELWQGAAGELENIFKAVDEELFFSRGAIFAALEMEGGKLMKSTPNLVAAQKVYDESLQVIKKVVSGAGYGWVEDWVNKANMRGQELGEWSVIGFGDLIRNRDVLLAAYKNFNDVDRFICTAGLEDGYKILDTYGADIADYFRRETLRAIIEGIPVQSLPGSKADSLAKRIWEGGRVGKGKLPSLTQRAVTIARVELSRIENDTYTQKSQELGLDWGINVNPLDERTTSICTDATLVGPMKYQDWVNSYGLPPRLNPFHLCRSTMVWGEKEWLAAA